MQIKTYKSVSMKDVLSRIKTELGNDAVIISTREIKNDTYGMLARPMVEVTAAVDYDDELFSRHVQHPRPRAGAETAPRKAAVTDFGEITSEMAEMKRMMNTLLALSGASRPRPNPLRDTLIARGIRESLVDMITDRLGDKAQLDEIRGLLGKILRASGATDGKIHVFLGTTGVGKTTTVAKLAARLALNEHRQVGIVTLDTYRIGAVEQSRIYARILNIPLYSASTVEEFRQAITHLKDKDTILVDTVGRSAFCEDFIDGMRPYFDRVPVCKYLLLPVATREREMEKITKSFLGLGIDRMIFTKADEALVHGSIITHNLVFRIPVSHITVGQRVPEDIEEASPSRILDLCLGDMT